MLEDIILVLLRKDVNVCTDETTLQKCLILYYLLMIFHSYEGETKIGKKLQIS